MIQIGSRVKVFDGTLFINDTKTPLSFTVRLATVTRRYSYQSTYNPDWIYPDVVDVCFDHRPHQISHGHFTEGVQEV